MTGLWRPRALVLLAIAGLAAGCLPARQVRTVSLTKSSSTSSLKPSVAVELVKFSADDKVVLSGKLFGKGRTGVILTHSFLSDQNSWTTFAADLARSGYTVLTFDFRGYGLSSARREPAKFDKDIKAAAEFINQRVEKVFLIGAGTGGTAAVKAAAAQPFAGVATLSAPEKFQGLSTGAGLGALKGAKLFLAAGEDGEAPDSARRFYALSAESRELEIFPGNRHGVEMLRDPRYDAGKILADWLKKAAPGET